jgi:hypothetical protein
MGIAPATTYSMNKIEIVTQHTNGSHLLAAARTITSHFELEEA